MKLNRKWLLVIALVMSLSLATASTLAFLTDRDTVENTFTMGNVDIEVEEDFPEGGAPIGPGEEVNKDAKISNVGNNAAWVWMTVSVPENLNDYVTLRWANGFEPTASSPVITDGQAVYTVLVEDPLPAGESTDYILDSVTLSPLLDYQDGQYVVVEDGVATALEGLENGKMIVTVNGYATQADEFDSVQQARRAYQNQWGEETELIVDGRVEYNGVIYEDIYAGVEAARENGGTIRLLGSATMDATATIPANITIDGDGHQLSRAEGFTGTLFNVDTGVTLTVNDLTMDGAGATATGYLIGTTGSGSVVLNDGTVLKNNNGAHAVNLATRGGGTLTLNGAEIVNNSSDSGAIWGGGHIIINDGSKVNNNSSTGSAGAIRMVSGYNLTMNGGEISGNTAAADGGAIWGYGASTYIFSGGKMSGNTSGGVGGALYTGEGSTVTIDGDFELTGNTAKNTGGFRLTKYGSCTVKGGLISGNVSEEDPQTNGLYAWSNALNLLGGQVDDNVLIAGGYMPTVGGSDNSGVVKFDVSYNHNTINLVKDFAAFEYIAAGSYFDAFHFQPASGYTYTEGDEDKLICLNEGYTTVWDAASGTFRLKAE